MKTKRVRVTHLRVNAMVELRCHICDIEYQGDNGWQPEDLGEYLVDVAADATAIGWRVVNGSAYCPDCIRKVINGGPCLEIVTATNEP